MKTRTVGIVKYYCTFTRTELAHITCFNSYVCMACGYMPCARGIHGVLYYIVVVLDDV